MNVLYAAVAAALCGCSIYMILSRNLARMVLGLSLLTTAVNLVLFQTGRFRSALPPVIPEGANALGESADPVPQALILTAIVIGFALTVVLSGLTLRAWRAHGTLSSREIVSAESLGAPDPEEEPLAG